MLKIIARFLPIMFISFITMFVSTGCNLDDGTTATPSATQETKKTYQNKIAPPNFVVTFPASLTATKDTPLVQSTRGETSQSSGYKTLKDGVKSIKTYAKQFDMYFIFIDIVLASIENKIVNDTPYSIKEGDFKIIYTEEIVNKILESCQEWGEDIEGLEEEMKKTIGTEIPCPAMTITKYASPADGYNYIVSMNRTQEDIETQMQIKMEMTIKWNLTKNKIFIYSNFKTTSDSMPEDLNYSVKFAYDATAALPKSSIQIDFTMGTTNMKNVISAQETGIKNGVLVDYSVTSNMGSMDYSYLVKGLADDDGGYINTTYDDSTTKAYWKETFNGTGDLTGSQYSFDGIKYTDSGEYDSFDAGEYDDNYNEYETEYASSYTLNYTGNATELVITSSFANDNATNATDDFWLNSIGYATKNADSGEWYISIWDEDLVQDAKLFEINYDTNTVKKVSGSITL